MLVAAAAAAPARIEAVRVAEYDSRTRVVLELDQVRAHKLLVLDTRPRVVLDIASSSVHARLPARGTGVVRGMRHARHQRDKLRVVLDLHAPATARSVAIAPVRPGESHRIVVDIFPRLGKPQPEAGARPDEGARNVLIAIDPGHGGKDPGAIGRHGYYEKTAVLAIAQRLARLVGREPGMSAMLTREGDYFLKLRRRYEMARDRDADLFISIHADAVRNRQVRGSSVYVLSDKGSSDEARRLARRENAADLIGGVELEDYPPQLASVLLDMQQKVNIRYSHKVGDDVLQRLHGVGRVRKSTVQMAPFAVLKAPDVPSILVETAYISNPQEERLLKTGAYQEKLAQALLAGIRGYFYDNPPDGTLIEQQVEAGQVPQKQYVARRGDTLSGIAQQFKVPLPVLIRANNLPSDRIRAGQILTIPAS